MRPASTPSYRPVTSGTDTARREIPGLTRPGKVEPTVEEKEIKIPNFLTSRRNK